VLHDEKQQGLPGLRVRAFADVVQRTDVRVIEGGDGACFTFETRSSIRVGREPFTEKFDGDRTLEPRVSRSIHLAL
jgi:hypothetical protein